MKRSMKLKIGKLYEKCLIDLYKIAGTRPAAGVPFKPKHEAKFLAEAISRLK